MAKQESKAGVEKDQNLKTMAALAYIIFFIPMITNKDSKFAMYHANQGVALLLSVIVLTFIGGFIGGFFQLIVPGVVGIVFAVMGIMNALNGEMKPLPLVGTINIIK